MSYTDQWLCEYGNIIVNYMIKNKLTLEELASKFELDTDTFIYMMRGNIELDDNILENIVYMDT